MIDIVYTGTQVFDQMILYRKSTGRVFVIYEGKEIAFRKLPLGLNVEQVQLRFKKLSSGERESVKRRISEIESGEGPSIFE